MMSRAGPQSSGRANHALCLQPTADRRAFRSAACTGLLALQAYRGVIAAATDEPTARGVIRLAEKWLFCRASAHNHPYRASQRARGRRPCWLRSSDHGRVADRHAAALGAERRSLASEVRKRDGGRGRPVHLRRRAGGSAAVHRPRGAALSRRSPSVRRVLKFFRAAPRQAARASRRPGRSRWVPVRP